jgi:CheY-like chemotaxis protein
LVGCLHDRRKSAVTHAAERGWVLDLSMPAGAGMEVLRRTRNSTTAAFRPVVVITGSEDP